MSKNNRFRKYNTTVLPVGRVKISNWPLKEKLIKVLIYTVLAVVAYFFLAGNAGLVHLVQSKLEKSKIERDINSLEEENRKATAEIQALRSDLKSVERIAREELGLIKKGEVVYKFIIKKESENDSFGSRNGNKR